MKAKPKSMAIAIEILQQSYWEHFKAAKDLALYLPVSHPKRQAIENELKFLLNQIKKEQDNEK